MTLRRWRRKEWGYTWGSNYIKLLPQAVITKSTYPLVLNNTISYNLITSDLFDAEVPAMPTNAKMQSVIFDAEVPAMPTYKIGRAQV